MKSRIIQAHGNIFVHNRNTQIAFATQVAERSRIQGQRAFL
jgi:hypothetical protein